MDNPHFLFLLIIYVNYPSIILSQGITGSGILYPPLQFAMLYIITIHELIEFEDIPITATTLILSQLTHGLRRCHGLLTYPESQAPYECLFPAYLPTNCPDAVSL
jgi:hypothetical protein